LFCTSYFCPCCLKCNAHHIYVYIYGLLNAPLHPAPQIRRVFRRHCALYKFTYLLTLHAEKVVRFNIHYYNYYYFWSLFSCQVFHIYFKVSRVVPDFSSRNGKSGTWPFFRNPAKSRSGQISSWICRMPVQLQYVQLMTGPNAAHLPGCHVVYLQF